MAHSAIAALCLLALASAAPQNLQKLQCATACDPTRQAKIGMIGKTYSFNYNIQSSVKLVGVNEAVTKGRITGVVDVSRINPCELTIKFTSSNEAVKVNKYPLVVSIVGDGHFGKVCTHPDDDSESINIKKGIASTIQYSLPSFTPTKKHIVTEKSVLGTCRTTYAIENNGQNWVVTKENVHGECQDHLYSQSEIPSLLSKSPMPLEVSKSVCTQVYSLSKVPQTITCKDTKVIRPAYGAYKFIEATQDSTLQFTSESTDMTVLSSIKGSQLLSKELRYDHSMPVKNPALVAKLDAVLSQVCEMAQGQGHTETASKVNKAIELMRQIPDDAFVTVLNKIRAGAYCADYSKLEALYMDAIAFISEPGAVEVIAKEVSAGRVNGGRTALYTAALHLLSKPTVQHVAALAPIASMDGPSSPFMLCAASVVKRHCKLSGCENTPAVNDILNRLTDKLVNQCTPSFSNSNPVPVITTLKTIEHIGHLTSEHAEKVINCAKTEGVEINVRFAATMVLNEAPCKTHAKKIIQDIVLNRDMNTEVRIGSYLAVIKCADEGDLQEIIAKIMADSNKQVQNFVLSHLNNLKETNWPIKAHLQKLLQNVNVPTNYESNIFKFSRNIEMSYNMPILGVGAAVESNVVFTPESYIPRLMNIGLDMNLLGSFVNIGEVAARVEGYDPIMTDVFGPESYLHKTPLAEVIKDTSLFIQKNGANIFHNLEKLIRQNRSLDIKSIIQSVSKFLNDNHIKLPKTALYAKLMGHEYAFLSHVGPQQEVNINHVVKTITSAVIDALVATKDLNINTARTANLHVDYAIPTIQGVPLKINLESTAVTGIQAQSKLDSNSKAQDALLKFIPSFNLAIDGHIGFGAIMKHGLKMKNAIYLTNGLTLHVSLKNGQDLEWKLELPEKMELVNVKSEIYQVTVNNLMVEEKIYPNNIKDVRVFKKHCSAIIEPVTGLHICFTLNVPDIPKSNSLPLGMPTQFNIYLHKSDAEMKGYRVYASLRNKADEKILKMVAGTYGSTSSTESSTRLTYNKQANGHQAAAEIKSLWFTSRIEGHLIHQAELMTMQIFANHQFKAGAPKAFACKFDVKKITIANGNKYQLTGFAGLTEILANTHKFLSVRLIHAKNGDVINADVFVNVEPSVLPLAIELGLDIPSNAPWFTVVRKVELKANVGSTEVEVLVLRKMPGQYQNIFAIQHGGSKVIFILAMHNVGGIFFTNFYWITETSAKRGTKKIGTIFSLKHKHSVIDTLWSWQNGGAKVFNINVKHSMESSAYTTTIEIGLPTLPKTMKISNVINVIDFLSYQIMTGMYMDNTALLQIEGPVSLQFSNMMIKHNMDLKISGAFGGKIKIINAALVSLKKIQYTLDMRHSTTPIAIIDATIDRTNAVQTTANAIIHIPILVKAEYGATATSSLVHTTMNSFILPTTRLARRFKGYADLNLEDQKLKTEFFWDAEKDTTKKIALTTGVMTDSSLGQVLVQGDLTLITLKYGYKLKALIASPLAWFSGTSGIELAVTAPSNKVMVAKALFIVEHTSTLVMFTPLVALQTLDENKYGITGTVAIKNLPAIWNFDITSEIIINIPHIPKIAVTTEFTHEDKNAACAIVLKSTISGITKPIALEITYGALEDKYTTLFKVQHGSTVGSVATNVELLSGIKAFDITIDASLPFTVVKALSMRVNKKAEGSITWTFSKNQIIQAKLHYSMPSWTAHTFHLESTSRTIEFIVSVSGNEINLKVFPEKNISSKMHKTVIRLINKVESAHIECFINTPSLSKEVRIAAEFSLADPTMGRMVNVNLQLPTTEISTFVHAILEDLVKIYEDLVKDGLVPNMIVVYYELKKTLRELPRHLNTVIKIVIEYWSIVWNWALRIWKNYEPDVIAIVKAVHTEVLHYWKKFLHYWEILKIEVPVLLSDVVHTVKKSEMWEKVWGLVNEIWEKFPVMQSVLLDFYNKLVLTTVIEIKELVNRIMNLPSFRLEKLWKVIVLKLPAIWANLKQQLLNTELITIIYEYLHTMEMQITKILTRYWNILRNWALDIWRDYEADVIGLIWFIHTGFLHYWEILRINVPILYNDIIEIVKNTGTWKIIHGMINQMIERFPFLYTIIHDLYHNVIWTIVTEIKEFADKIMNLPSLRFESLWKLLKNELPSIWAKFRKQLVNAELTTATIKKFNDMKLVSPTVHAAMVDIWARVIKPVWTELVTMFNNIMNINFTNISQMIDQLLKEVPAAVNNIVTHLMDGFLHYYEILMINVPILYNDIFEIVKNTGTWKMLHGMINQMIEQFPFMQNILLEFNDKVIWTTVTEIEELVIKIINLPSLRFESLWQLLKNELPAIGVKLQNQLVNAELTTVTIKKFNDMKLWFPTVHTAMVGCWAHVIMPVWTELGTMFRNIMNINFTDISQMIDHLLIEVPAFVKNVVTYLMDKEAVRMYISVMNEFIEANPVLRSAYEAAIEISHNIMMTLWSDLAMLFEKLMTIPFIKKIVIWVQHIVMYRTINMELSLESVTDVVQSFGLQVLGVIVAGDHISAVVPLPISVFTLKPMLTVVTVHIPAFVVEIMNSLTAVIGNIPVWVTTMKEQIPVILRIVETHLHKWLPVLINLIENIPVFITEMKKQLQVFVKALAKQIPVIGKAVKNFVLTFINEMVPVINELIEYLMNTEAAKVLMVKIEEVIRNNQKQFNAMQAYIERFFHFAEEIITNMMEIPIIRKIVEYIWDLFQPKNINTSMLSLLNMVSSNMSLPVSSNWSAFIKQHSPSVTSSWLSYFVQ